MPDLHQNMTLVHDGKKVFKCANCDACYKEISSHPENRMFRWAKCTYTLLTQKANLNLHRKSFHEVKKNHSVAT